jgi:hypothetical protein
MVSTRVRRIERVLGKKFHDRPFRKNRRMYYDGEDAEIRLFVTSRHDVDEILNYVNPREIDHIEAITSEQHLDLLRDPRFKIESKDHLYYHKHEYKVNIRVPGDNGDRWSRRDGKPTVFMRVSDFLKTQAERNEYSIRQNWQVVTVFTSEEIVFNVLPLIRFEMQIEDYDIVRVVVPDLVFHGEITAE